MKEARGCIYGRSKQGHFDNYTKVLCSLLEFEREDSRFRQWARVLSFQTIVFLDATWHLFFLPALIIRSILGRNNVFIVMRSRFVKSRHFGHSLKRWLLITLRRLTNTYLISIDRRGRDRQLEEFYDLFIDDIQLWDLRYLNVKPRRPPEVSRKLEGGLLIPGIIDCQKHRKCPDELLAFLKGYEGRRNIIMAGQIRNCEWSTLHLSSQVRVIPRYVSDEELLYLYSASDIVYCYYSLDVDQPSGVFGRAVQMKKWALVKSGSYLDRHYDYPRKIVVSSLDELYGLTELPEDDGEVKCSDVTKYDSSQALREFVTRI